MAETDGFLDHNMHGKAIREVKIDTVASDPSGGGLYKGRMWFNTTTNVLMVYDGTTKQTVAFGAGASALKFVGVFDAAAAAGALPTVGSDGEGITAGDTWLVTVAGTVGSALALHVGDQLVAKINDADADAEFFVVHGETVDLSPYSREEVKTNQSFTADVEKTVTASNLSAIRDAEVYRDVNEDGSRFEKITDGVQVQLDGSDSTKVYITCGIALTGAKIVLQGTSN